MINYFKDIFIIYGIKRILSWLSGNIVEFSFSIPETGEFFIRKIFEKQGNGSHEFSYNRYLSIRRTVPVIPYSFGSRIIAILLFFARPSGVPLSARG